MAKKRKTKLSSDYKFKNFTETPSSAKGLEVSHSPNDIEIAPEPFMYDGLDINLDIIKVLHTACDNHISCTHCYYGSDSHEYLGVMNVQGQNKDLYKCYSCNYVFDGVPNSIQAYLKQVSNLIGDNDVSFSKTSQSKHVQKNNEEMEMKIEDLNNIVRNMGSDINISIQNLQRVIEVQQQELQELKNDPVRGLKDIVNGFNLD